MATKNASAAAATAAANVTSVADRAFWQENLRRRSLARSCAVALVGGVALWDKARVMLRQGRALIQFGSNCRKREVFS
jgi:hypothetical protein